MNASVFTLCSFCVTTDWRFVQYDFCWESLYWLSLLIDICCFCICWRWYGVLVWYWYAQIFVPFMCCHVLCLATSRRDIVCHSSVGPFLWQFICYILTDVLSGELGCTLIYTWSYHGERWVPSTNSVILSTLSAYTVTSEGMPTSAT